MLTSGSNDGTLTREQLAETARSIDVYESVLKTGNAALDVVLMEMGLLAKQDGVTLSCVADGHALDFMPAPDLYTLFSAMLDRSLHCMQMLGDARRKSVSLNVRTRMGMASITLEHYLPMERIKAEVELGWVTLQNILEVVKRYEGTMSHSDVDADVMHLDILIPQEQGLG